MSRVELREAVLASPLRARSLLTVRAAISLARLFGVPRSSRLSSMCSYCRSRLSDHASCGMRTHPLVLFTGVTARRSARLRLEGLVLDVVLSRVGVRELVDELHPLAVRVVDPHERL